MQLAVFRALALALATALLCAPAARAQCTKTPPGKRCAGAPGRPEVPYLGGCCVGECVADPSRGWGLWCAESPSGGSSGAGGGGDGDGGEGCDEEEDPPATLPPQTTAAPPTTEAQEQVTATQATQPQEPNDASWVRVPGSTGTNFYGLTYSPFAVAGAKTCPPFKSNATGGFCLASKQVAIDLEIIGSMTRRIRTYGINPCYDNVIQILDYARANGMKVQLGVWQEGNEDDDKEIETLGKIVESHSDVISEALVGNELVFIIGQSTTYQAQRLRAARKVIKSKGKTIPVGAAEIWTTWMENKDAEEIVKASDFVGLQIHPWYSGLDPLKTDVGKVAIDSAFAISEKWNKPVIITETGYPSAGPNNNNAITSESRLEKTAADTEKWSRKRNTPVYFFEPFNGDWKRRWLEGNHVEIDLHFGLRDCARVPKKLKLPPGGAV